MGDVKEMRYIEIDKEEIPYKFEINLADETFEFGINYNELGDFFTVDLYKNTKPIILGQKIMYKKELFDGILEDDLPRVLILPYDTTEQAERVGYDELENDVLLFIVTGDDYVD